MGPPNGNRRGDVGLADVVEILGRLAPDHHAASLTGLANKVSVSHEEFFGPTSIPVKAVATPSQTDEEPAPPTALNVAFVRMVRYEAFDVASPPNPASLRGNSDSHDPRERRLPIDDIPAEPLQKLSDVLTQVRKLLTVRQQTRELDIPRIVKRMGRGEFLEKLPVRTKRKWGESAQLIFDRSIRLTPFWGDQHEIISSLRGMYRQHGTDTALLRADNDLVLLGQAGPRPYQLPPPGAAVIAISDLGSLATVRTDVERFWSELGRRLRDNGNSTLALVPTLKSHVGEFTTSFWEVVPWGIQPTVESNAMGDVSGRLERLVTLISPVAVRLEPDLLRSIRLLIPEFRSDPGWEARVWQHRIIRHSNPEAATFDPDVQRDYRLRFEKEISPDLQKAVLSRIKSYYRRRPEWFWTETVCSLSTRLWSELAREERKDAIYALSRRADRYSESPCNFSTRAWISRFVDRVQNQRESDPTLCRSFSQLYRAIRPEDETLQTVPSWFVPDPNRHSLAHVRLSSLVQIGDQFRIDPDDSEGKNKQRVGSLLGCIRSRNQELVLGESDFDPFWLTGHPPAWASDWGTDRYGAWAEFTVGTVTQRMRWIEPGTFTMGSPKGEEGRDDDEGPVHDVTISKGYWLFDTPCCQELWDAVMGEKANRSRFKGPRRPTENLDWNEAVAFTEKLNELKPGLNLRLPREAEWEYACRAGTTTTRYGELDDVAWHSGNSGRQTHDVGLKPPNAWGLFDTLGNVDEWCDDSKRDYTQFAINDADGGRGAVRVIRGGGWADPAQLARAACRNAILPGARVGDLGFRPLSSGDQPGPVGTTRSESSRRAEPGAERSGAQKFSFFVKDSASVAIPEFPSFQIETDCERLVFDRITKPDWADAIGRDKYGLWATLKIEGAVQKLRWISPGRFTMGSPPEEEGRFDREGPTHSVVISKGFWLFDTPCCQDLWERVMGNKLISFGFPGPRRPVENVTWNEAVTFTEKLNELRPGLFLRLPREAEWEYACRAGSTSARYGELDDIAWHGGNSERQTHDVGSKRENAWGLYDMLGNVWEWCGDDQRTYANETVVDPDGGLGAERVIRGGSWAVSARLARAAFRLALHPGDRGDFLGFRPLGSGIEEMQVEDRVSGANEASRASAKIQNFNDEAALPSEKRPKARKSSKPSRRT